MKKNESARIKTREFKNLLNHTLCILFTLFIQISFASEESKRLHALNGHQIVLTNNSIPPPLPQVYVPEPGDERAPKPSLLFSEPSPPVEPHKPAPVSTFVQSIRDAAKPFHIQAVDTPLMQAIFTGTITEQEFAFFQYAILEIYNMLDTSTDFESLPGMNEFLQLVKRDISQDLVMEFLEGKHISTLKNNAALNSFAERVRSAQSDAVLLMAHTFVLYGGDLAASTILHPKLKGANIPERLIVRYSFLDEDVRIELQSKMRALLDSINNLYPLRAKDFEAEVLKSYELNLNLFSTLYPLPAVHERIE